MSGAPRSASPNARVLAHAAGIGAALFLAFAFRAAVDGAYPFTVGALSVTTLQTLPFAVTTTVVAAAIFGLYGLPGPCSWRDAGATAALGVALLQPFAPLSGGTPLPLLMVPLDIVLIAAALAIADRRAFADRAHPWHQRVDGGPAREPPVQ